MGRAKKKGAPASGEFSLFDESDSVDSDVEEDLPKDEAGRAKIKQQYVELLGIRVQKLAGRILNRERINKTVEGVYFICAQCKRVCHNLDEGLLEDADNAKNLCTVCSKGGDGSKSVRKPTVKKAASVPVPELPEDEPQPASKSAKPDKADKADKLEKLEKAQKAEKPVKGGKSDKTAKPASPVKKPVKK